jgi:hypothetical protein
MCNIFNTLLYICALLDGCLLFTSSLLCDWFYILWLRPCKDVLERVNKYNTKDLYSHITHSFLNCVKSVWW